MIPLGILALSGVGGGSSYELIESNILASSASSVTFSSIPQDFKHLQIRAVMRNGTVNNTQFQIRFNAITTTSYDFHRLSGDGSVSSYSLLSRNSIFNNDGSLVSSAAPASIFSPQIIDILDFSNPSKNTTVRSFYGNEDGAFGTRKVGLGSGALFDLAAITTTELLPGSGTFASGSRFSLYGIRG